MGSVIALMLLFACTGCGQYDRVQINARETAAIADLRMMNQAQLSFHLAQGKYAVSLHELCVSEMSGTVCSGEHLGYIFALASSSPAESYTIAARPKTPGSSGRRFFYSDQTLVIRQSENGPATASSLELR